jgi:hypothetical protein
MFMRRGVENKSRVAIALKFFRDLFEGWFSYYKDYYATQSLKPLKSDQQFSQDAYTQGTQKNLFPLNFGSRTIKRGHKSWGVTSLSPLK